MPTLTYFIIIIIILVLQVLEDTERDSQTMRLKEIPKGQIIYFSQVQ